MYADFFLGFEIQQYKYICPSLVNIFFINTVPHDYEYNTLQLMNWKKKKNQSKLASFMILRAHPKITG